MSEYNIGRTPESVINNVTPAALPEARITKTEAKESERTPLAEPLILHSYYASDKMATLPRSLSDAIINTFINKGLSSEEMLS